MKPGKPRRDVMRADSTVGAAGVQSNNPAGDRALPSDTLKRRCLGAAQKKTAVRGRASRTAVGGESENREALQDARSVLAVWEHCCFCNVFYITESAQVNRKI